MKNRLAQHLLLLGLAGCLATAHATESDAEATIAELEKRIAELESTMEERLNILADDLDEARNQQAQKDVHFGGYGEMHYRRLDDNGEDVRELDFHRWVFFIGYDFNDKMRFVSEFELEHSVSPGSEGNGAVELEQAYIEIDLDGNKQLKTGIILTPVGIINETHEPPTFYGVERPLIETTIIPSTWFVGGMMFSHQLSDSLGYDLMLSEGLKTEETDPFYLKGGKQKASFSDVFDLAATARVRYRLPGFELAGFVQYQPDIDQSARDSYADAASLFGGHLVYQFTDITVKALYARWDLYGEQAEQAEQDVQLGGYIELSYRPAGSKWGIYTRQSGWTQQTDVTGTEVKFGANYYPHDNIVFKADYQRQNDEANNPDVVDGTGINLGMGYQF